MTRRTRRGLLVTLIAAAGGGCIGSDGPSSTPGESETPGRTTPTDDNVVWRAEFASSVYQPRFVGNEVYVATGEPQTRGTRSASESGKKPQGQLAALDAANGETRWRAPNPSPFLSPPYVDDSGVYAIAGRSRGTHGVDNRLRKVRHGGQGAWRTDTIDQFINIVALGPDRAYLGTSDDAIGVSGQRLFAVGTGDGEQRWSVESGDVFNGFLHEDQLLVDVGGRAIAAYNPTSGGRRWQTTAQVLRDGSRRPSVVNRTAFVAASADDADRFVALDLRDGSERWSYRYESVEPFVLTGAAVVGDGVVGTEYDGLVFSLDVEGGRERWRVMLEGEARYAPVVADGTAFISTFRSQEQGHRSTVSALDVADGSVRWQTTFDGVARPIPSGDVLLVRQRAGEEGGQWAVRALDMASGEERWAFETAERLTDLVVGDAYAYVGSDAGVVRALNESR